MTTRGGAGFGGLAAATRLARAAFQVSVRWAADFRAIDPRCARIVLLEAGPRLLPAFDPLLSEKARRSLEQLGVELRLGAAVTDCDCSGVNIGAERIETRTKLAGLPAWLLWSVAHILLHWHNRSAILARGRF